MAVVPPQYSIKKFSFYLIASFVIHFFTLIGLSKFLPSPGVKEVRVALEIAPTPTPPTLVKPKAIVKPKPKAIAPMTRKRPEPKAIPRENSFPSQEIPIDKDTPSSMFKENLAAKKTTPLKPVSQKKEHIKKSSPAKQTSRPKTIAQPKTTKKAPQPPPAAAPKEKLASKPKEFAIRTEELFRKYNQPTDSTIKERPKDFGQILSNLDKHLEVEKYGDVGFAGEGILSFADENFKAVWYGRIVKKKVADGWFLPYAARVLGLTGRTTVTFQIHRNGEITNIKLKESSGNSSLDKAALFAIENAGPLPDLPSDYTYDTLRATFFFYYNLPLPSEQGVFRQFFTV